MATNYGSSCTHDRQDGHNEQYGHNNCSFVHSACVSNVCRCAATHAYDKTKGICVTECDVLGSEFVLYPGRNLRHDTVTLKGSDPVACKDACLARTDFVCHSFDSFDRQDGSEGSCALSDHAPASTKDSVMSTFYLWDYYRRQCANTIG